jgi:hypothetical protein
MREQIRGVRLSRKGSGGVGGGQMVEKNYRERKKKENLGRK